MAHQQTYLFDESVLAFFPCVEIWKISMEQGGQHTRHSVLHSIWGALPHTQYECGVLFICSIGIPEPLRR